MLVWMAEFLEYMCSVCVCVCVLARTPKGPWPLSIGRLGAGGGTFVTFLTRVKMTLEVEARRMAPLECSFTSAHTSNSTSRAGRRAPVNGVPCSCRMTCGEGRPPAMWNHRSHCAASRTCRSTARPRRNAGRHAGPRQERLRGLRATRATRAR